MSVVIITEDWENAFREMFNSIKDPILPTWAQPGSAEKCAVLARRYDGRVPLWHPQDYIPDRKGKGVKDPCSLYNEDSFTWYDNPGRGVMIVEDAKDLS